MLGATITLLLAAASVDLVQPAALDQQRTCYDPRRDSYPYLSTKTAYERVHGNVSRPESSCSPAQIWMLSRHGTRYAGSKVVKQLRTLTGLRDQIVKNHESRDGRLCDEDLQRLKSWQPDPNISEEWADLLAPQGSDDLRMLAKRLQHAYPELLQVDPRNVNPEDFVFRATNTQRTQESLKSFARGLFGSSEVIKPETPPVNDTLLLMHKNCPAWNSGYDPVLTNMERDKFTDGPEFQALLKDLSQRLGFNQPMNFSTMKSMYDMCRFESAWYVNSTSVWCSFFTPDELKVLEYREDLNYYYCCGPGRDISGKLGCPLLTDMFEHFKRLASGSTKEPKAVFYFAHTITLQNFMTALKIGFESEPPLASNYLSSSNRNYRTSILGPFATNVVAVFYRCNGSKSPNKVTFHVAERLKPLAGCNSDGTCDWESLERSFGHEVGSCNDMNFCNEEKVPGASTSQPETTTGSGTDRASEQILKLTAIVMIIASQLTGL